MTTKFFREKYYLLIFLVFIIVLMNSCAIIGDDKSDPTTSEEYTQYINLSKDDLIMKINELSQKEEGLSDDEKFNLAVTALYEKAQSFTDDDLITIIEDDSIASTVKCLFLELSEKINNGQGILDQSLFDKYITQKSLDEIVRIKMFSGLDMSSEERKDTLENIIRTEEGIVVGHALVQLEINDLNRALRMADEVIDNHESFCDDAIRSAVNLKSGRSNLSFTGSEKEIAIEKKQFVDFCISQFNISENQKLKNAMIYSLIRINDIGAVKAILNNENVDRDLKRACVRRSYKIFVDAINNNPTKEDVDLIIKAMEILPIKDLAGLMKQKIASNPALSSTELDIVIGVMESRGVPADTRS